MQIKARDIRQNKSDSPRKLLQIQQCPDCGLYDRHIDILQPGQSYEVLKAGSSIKECPNCKSKNFAAVVTVSEEEVKIEPPRLSEKKQGKYRNIVLEGRFYPDGSGCQCPPFKKEMEFKAAAEGEKNWEPMLPIQICPQCDKEYHLDWTVTERNYF